MLGWPSMTMDRAKEPTRPACSHRGDAKPYQRCIDAHHVCLAATPWTGKPLFPHCSPVAVSTSRRGEVGLTHFARGCFTFELRVELNTVRSRRSRRMVQFTATEWSLRRRSRSFLRFRGSRARVSQLPRFSCDDRHAFGCGARLRVSVKGGCVLSWRTEAIGQLSLARRGAGHEK
jgi:hypothetical protein